MIEQVTLWSMDVEKRLVRLEREDGMLVEGEVDPEHPEAEFHTVDKSYLFLSRIKAGTGDGLEVFTGDLVRFETLSGRKVFSSSRIARAESAWTARKSIPPGPGGGTPTVPDSVVEMTRDEVKWMEAVERSWIDPETQSGREVEEVVDGISPSLAERVTSDE